MTEIRLASGRTLTPGTEFSVSGTTGRYRFRSYDTRGWIECYGGRTGREQYHALAIAIDPTSGETSREITVHRVTKMRGG